ncbi:MAG TPA: redox-regulated ATPase YchF [Blastocatellia bacterium]|nr:redox-regulated ATPase YchF [Blastocatellia bacterium]
MLRAGIVGLPNVGKSTLFNALTATRGAESANYPFSTTGANVGVINVPDARLAPLAKIAKTNKIVYATVEFVDIAGLAKGASQGEGLGNQFLHHIRETELIVHVVRCFEDENVVHVEETINPRRDVETLNLELILADLATVEKRRERVTKQAKVGDKTAKEELDLLDKLQAAFDDGRPARLAGLTDEEKAKAYHLFLLTMKPMIYVANVSESDLSKPETDFIRQVREHAESEGVDHVVISAQLEADLVDLEPEERPEYMASLGVTETGLGKLIRGAYHTLGLISFFTAGEKEARAWTIRKGAKAPEAAGEIHSDIERGFIRAQVVAYNHMIEAGSEVAAKEKGWMRLEGKEYVVQDADVIEFRFNV